MPRLFRFFRSLLRLRIRIPQVLTLLGVVVVGVSLWVANRLVQDLANAERRRLDLYVEILKFNASNENEETAFLFNNVVRAGASTSLINVPAIITDSLGNIVADNLVLPPGYSENRRVEAVEEELARMMASPDNRLIIEYATGQYQTLWYRDSDTLRQLRLYPVITLVILGTLIAIAFFNFSISQRDSQNRLWAGLAKETAHQLGTPISGLMAWTELLRLQNADDSVVNEMQADISHLQQIAERFSKIGSAPELDWQPLSPLLHNAVEYVKTRLARSGRYSILLSDSLPANYQVKLNPVLFQWVIENLVKNAMDAMAGLEQGAIVLRAEVQRTRSRKPITVLEVEDTGRGIASKHLKDVFKPGFTTKKRGWGLGLSLSRRIVENYHNGRIYVKRSVVNKGTTFRIVLPGGNAPVTGGQSTAPK